MTDKKQLFDAFQVLISAALLAEPGLTVRDKKTGVRQRMVLAPQPIYASDELCGDCCPNYAEYAGYCVLRKRNDAFGDKLEPAYVEDGGSPKWQRSEACKQGEAQLER